MIKPNLSRRLRARMQFKSLLLLTILAGSVSAQTPPLPLAPTEPSATQSSNGSAASVWTLRQHATWLLGLRARPTTLAVIQPDAPTMPTMPMAEILSAPIVRLDNSVPQIQLVQHTEPATPATLPPALPSLPSLPTSYQPETSSAPGQVAPALHTHNDNAQVQPAHNAAPPSLNLGPVVGGPVPPLPLDQMESNSLLQVDVSGIDAARVASSPATNNQVESLIDGIEFPKPTQLSLRDSEPASIAASPSRNKRVSIHEGFAPRTSAANQAAEVGGSTGTNLQLSDKSKPGPSQAQQFSLSDNSTSLSLSDKKDTSSKTTGPILNRLSDGDGLNYQLADKQPAQPKPATNSPAIETSLSDLGPIVGPLPVASHTSHDKSSRSAQPFEIAPPSRLAKPNESKANEFKLSESKAGQPQRSDLNVIEPKANEPKAAEPKAMVPEVLASGVGQPELRIPSLTQSGPAKLQAESEPQPTLLTASAGQSDPATKLPASQEAVAKKTEPVAKTTSANAESLIDGLVPPTLPALPLAKANGPVTAATPTSEPAATLKSVPSPELIAKAEQPKSSPEKHRLSDANPIALKRPVVKAASVSIPASEDQSAVVPSSHEIEDASEPTAEYSQLAAKMQQAVKQKFPAYKIKVTCDEDGLIVEGKVPNNNEASKVLSFIRKTSLSPVADRVTTSQ